MHVSEGVLSLPVICAGWLGAAGLITIGLKKTKADQLPKAAVFGGAFFLSSLIKVPLAGSSAHFGLLGLLGLTLGYAAIPSIFIALFLQALLFQFGGLLSLGANTVIMTTPALCCHLFFKYGAQKSLATSNSAKKSALKYCAFSAGFGASIGSAFLLIAFLTASSELLVKSAWLILSANLPVAVLEGIVAMLTIEFLRKTAPNLIAESL